MKLTIKGVEALVQRNAIGAFHGDSGLGKSFAIAYAAALMTRRRGVVHHTVTLGERPNQTDMLVALLDKLTVYCEINQEYEAGLAYALLTLRYDRARERTHRRLMRLHYLAGDRSTALRQYERCVAALAEELGVKPDKRTLWLYEQICQDCLDSPAPPPTKTKTGVPIEPAVNSLTDVISRLKHLQTILLDVQRQVQQEIETAEIVLNR